MNKRESKDTNGTDEEFCLLEETIDSKEKTKKNLKSKFTSNFMNIQTNIGFAIYGKDGETWKNIRDSDHITFQGSQFQFCNFKYHYNELLWFTYRKNMPTIEVPDSNNTVTEDTSWGCAIRSCQMMLSTIIMKQFKNRELKEDKKLREEILKLFQDVRSKPFSIQNICSTGNKNYKAKAGEWWKPTTVLFTMKDQLMTKDHLKNVTHKNLKKQKSQKMHICMDHIIDIDQIYEQINDNPDFYSNASDNNNGSNTIKLTKTPQIKKECSEKFVKSSRKISYEVISNATSNEEESISPDTITNKNRKTSWLDWEVLSNSNFKTEDNDWKDGSGFEELSPNPIFIVQMVMTGLETPEPISIKIIDDLQKLKYSVGLIGGRPGKAYYIAGEVKDQFIYLDPHYAQEHITEDKLNKENMKTYQPHSIRLLSKSSADPSMGLGFQLYTDYDVNQFFSELLLLKAKYNKEFFWSIKDDGNRINTDLDVSTGDDFIMCESDLNTELTKKNESSTLKASVSEKVIQSFDNFGNTKKADLLQSMDEQKMFKEWEVINDLDLTNRTRKSSEVDQKSLSNCGKDNRSLGNSNKELTESMEQNADDSIIFV